MPNQTIFLNPDDKSDYLYISWDFNWKNLKVSYRNQLIGQVANSKELKQGQTFQLDENRTITVQLSGLVFSELEVLLDGNYIIGSASDPRKQLQSVYSATLVIGILNIALGLLAVMPGMDFLSSLGAGTSSLITGSLIIFLGYMVKKEHIAGLYTLILFFLADTLFSFYFLIQSGHSPTGALIFRIFILLYFFKGFKAFKTLSKEKKDIEIAS